MGFNAPVSVRAAPGSLRWWNGQLRVDENAHVVAAMHAAGVVGVAADPSKDPWWRWLSSGESDVPVATRRVVSKGNVERWESGATKFFAETITYKLIVNETFREVLGSEAGPYTYRLVLGYDPAVGEWRRYADGSGGQSPLDRDRSVLWVRAVESGGQKLPQLMQAIGDAQTRASDAIEKDLAQSGLLAKTADQGVLVSTRSGLAWNTHAIPVEGRSWAEAMEACGLLHPGKYGGWRTPTLRELWTLTRRGQTYPQIIDTPDRRLLGPAYQKPDGTYGAHFISRDVTGYNGKAIGPEYNGPIELPGLGVSKTGAANVDRDRDRPEGRRYNEYNRHYRLLCVATIRDA